MLTILFAPLCHICIHISCFQGFGSRQRKEAEDKKRCTEEEKNKSKLHQLLVQSMYSRCASSFRISKHLVIYRSIQVDEVGNFLYCMSYFLFSISSSFSLSVHHFGNRCMQHRLPHRMGESIYTFLQYDLW